MEGPNQISTERLSKWKGEAFAELKQAKAEEVWPLLEDFFGLHKWFPTLRTCIPIEGVSGQPGCVRYCVGFKTHVDREDKTTENWTKQKLLWIDPDNKVFSYSIVDGNVGFNGYVSTVKVIPMGEGCGIEWKYEVEPPNGWRFEDLDSFIKTGLQGMAKRMEEAIQAFNA